MLYAPDRVMFLQGAPAMVAVGILRCLDILMDVPTGKANPPPQQSNPPARQQIENAAPSISSPGRGSKRPAPGHSNSMPHFSAPVMQPPVAVSQQDTKRPRMDMVEIPSQAVAKIQVTGAQAGIVIGQKGSTIQQIRALSGARVNIDSHDEAQQKNSDAAKRDLREMTCVGTVAQCEAALNLLRQCFQHDNLLASSNSKGNGGNMNQNSNKHHNPHAQHQHQHQHQGHQQHQQQHPHAHRQQVSPHQHQRPHQSPRHHPHHSPHQGMAPMLPHHVSPHHHPRSPPPTPPAQNHNLHFEAHSHSGSSASRPFSPSSFSAQRSGSFHSAAAGAGGGPQFPSACPVPAPHAWRPY